MCQNLFLNIAQLSASNLIKKETLSEIFKNICFTEHLQISAALFLQKTLNGCFLYIC